MTDELLAQASAKVRAFMESDRHHERADPLYGERDANGKPLLAPDPQSCDGGLLAVLEAATGEAWWFEPRLGSAGDGIVPVAWRAMWGFGPCQWATTRFEAALRAIVEVLP